MLIQWRCSTDHRNEAIAVEGDVQAKTSDRMMILPGSELKTEEEHQRKPLNMLQLC